MSHRYAVIREIFNNMYSGQSPSFSQPFRPVLLVLAVSSNAYYSRHPWLSFLFFRLYRLLCLPTLHLLSHLVWLTPLNRKTDYRGTYMGHTGSFLLQICVLPGFESTIGVIPDPLSPLCPQRTVLPTGWLTTLCFHARLAYSVPPVYHV